MPPQTVTIHLGTDGDSDARSQQFDVMNHPSGIYLYTKHWDDSEHRGSVRVSHGKHSFDIGNVSIINGAGDHDDASEGVVNWHILFSLPHKKILSYGEARDEIMKLLDQLRVAGWKRYIEAADPRLAGQEATTYELSESGLIYSLDASYTPTMEEWIKLTSLEPRWSFYADGAFLNLTFSYYPSKTKDSGQYQMDIEIQTASDGYMDYFSDTPEKRKHWQLYISDELKPGKQERLATEAKLAAQGYTIDTTYQPPPFEAPGFSSNFSSNGSH